MDSLKSMNQAIDYIEAHLTEDIDLKEVARLALCSEYHFQRMFSFLAGVSLSEYIRRRRLTLAAFELSSGAPGSSVSVVSGKTAVTGDRIIDLAVKYGYSSADAFSRAFQALHGLTPSEARQNNQALKAYPRMTFQLTISGGNEMNYRIVEKEAFQVVGLMKRVPLIFSGVNPEIAAMYQQLTPELIMTLKALSDIEPKGMISASANFSDGREAEKGSLDHYIGVATTKACPEGLAELKVEAGTWAVFEAVGPFPETLQNIWGRIYSEWFPSSNYESTSGPELLWNESPDTSSPTYRSEIWVPVVKK